MPRLDARLKSVAQQVCCRVHADIGSDHGHLLKALLAAGRIQRGIAIENKRQPFLNSQTTLQGVNADVRFADGIEGLKAGEADSLSICGMGAESIVRILCQRPECVPRSLVLQPNGKPELIRQWGLDAGYHFVDEQVVDGQRVYNVLVLEHGDGIDDPAYEGIDREIGIALGPHQLQRWESDFIDRLDKEHQYLSQLQRRTEKATARLGVIERAREIFGR